MNQEPYVRFITGLQGTEIQKEEQKWLKKYRPLGAILFTRNCKSVSQVQNLVQDFRAQVGNPLAPVLIDQEGGLVTRLKPPTWPNLPSMGDFGAIYAQNPTLGEELLRLNISGIAAQLREVGVNVVTSPCVDVLQPITHQVIGKRAFGGDPKVVAHLGQIVVDVFLNFGILPVVKHFPGHGRARVDSHHSLPKVEIFESQLEKGVGSFFSSSHHLPKEQQVEMLKQTDWWPYLKIKNAPWLMLAHLKVDSLDANHVTSQSKKIFQTLKQEIGFQGVTISDCISMQALQGNYPKRALEVCQAGFDLVLCGQGKIEDLAEIAQHLKHEGFLCGEDFMEKVVRLKAKGKEWAEVVYAPVDLKGKKVDFHQIAKQVHAEFQKWMQPEKADGLGLAKKMDRTENFL